MMIYKMTLKTPTKLIFIAIGINLIITSLIFLSIIDFDLKEFFKFVFSLFINLLIGIIGLYCIGYLIGQNLYKIKNSNKKFSLFHGILAIFVVLIFGSLIGSTVGFVQEGLPNGYEYDLDKELFDYNMKPIFWILFFGFIPTLLSGIILGIKLKKLPSTTI